MAKAVGRASTKTGQAPSQIDRKAWKQEQQNYWKEEWDSGRFNDL
jgi:hypothetical protein